MQIIKKVNIINEVQTLEQQKQDLIDVMNDMSSNDIKLNVNIMLDRVNDYTHQIEYIKLMQGDVIFK